VAARESARRLTGPVPATTPFMMSATGPTLVEAPPWGIRPEQPIDIDQIHDLHRAAFRGAAEAELVDAVRASPGFIPELSLVAVTEDGSVLGHVLISRIGFVPANADGPTDVLALAPIGVLPAHQHRGIGTALTQAALSIADGREEPLVVVLGSPDFYSPFGFVPAAEVEVIGPYDAAGDAFQVRPRGGDGQIPPGSVSYPAPFSAV
jgi:putative acetyltransferase